MVVVGAGVFGAWTAHHLLTSGARVSIIDAYGAANARSSSGDESRIVRFGYGPDELYSRWALQSLTEWRKLFARLDGAAAPLFHACGVLWMASNAADPYTTATLDTVQRLGQPIHALDQMTLRTRWPHLMTDDIGLAVLEPSTGVLVARRAVQTLVADLEARGAQVIRGRAMARPAGRRLESVLLSDGTELGADAFVFACGAWLPKVFPDLLQGRVRPTRQTVIYFGTPAGDDRFGPSHTPAWVDFGAGIYGVPDIEARGLKVGIDAHGPAFDPDAGDRVLDAESIERTRAWLRHRMPALADAPIVESRVCQYENTSTGDFLIDRHPQLENVWIAGGGSGHGFKHGPAVGEYLAGLVRGTVDPEPRFSLSTKGTEPHRVVY
ncbi:MAG TPA: FAD-dependent oxidoreductase [Vicinamibacterales bacterium]|jgi:glycine/D-amino acid oxidase-like deaminating enzyme|nr:FAD-dependent oxidoreductase [Vicinamibacterales bacterium]